ncbi:hypothetical protein V6917_21780 [Pectobacterium brasiliense]|uniref:hypothetical protein n=1 Tax=Pectobacterium brasiliense TaxID=180957 RepID=UPI0030D02140
MMKEVHQLFSNSGGQALSPNEHVAQFNSADISRRNHQDRVMQRQLYRPGQGSQPAAKTPAETPASSLFKSPPPAKAKAAPKPGGKKMDREQRILMMILLLGVGYYLLYGTPSQRKKTLVGLTSTDELSYENLQLSWRSVTPYDASEHFVWNGYSLVRYELQTMQVNYTHTGTFR